ncbi:MULTISPECIES: helix-turn-helix transcriptional regulator [unclassified Rhodanobacter]|uniref:helix-turn-helix domain-containing protein n=1 Tax=unclassified Rhodanobacter TaxID=2621553 RepID=UPI001BE06AB5|nr:MULTISPECIES: helix-turn-helix transcriptional regulator [unclassified Rhodanobacter]MBT2145573.1 helix-turn-helix domain-containing protein [Rhodanobacter sp. LX-99]MBT2149618.1 helix-turn-helix domain-containing protein [Rhodanobacter sp. LX-100]
MSASLADRQALLAQLQAELLDGRTGIGAAVRRLRTELTGLRQEQFARMCRISLNTLQQLEHDQGNPTVRTLNAVFAPFGMRVGIVSRTPPAGTDTKS